MRTKARIDANQPELVDLWRKIGGSVEILSMVPGKLDLLCGLCGIDQRVEIKDGSKKPSAQKLTPSEEKVFKEWRGRPPVIWRCADDVFETRDVLMREAMKRRG